MKIAIINARNIFPLNGGDKLFSYNLLKVLAKQHEVHYINVVDEGGYSPAEINALEGVGKVSTEVISTKFILNAVALIKSCLLGMAYIKARRSDTGKIKKQIHALLETFKPSIIIWDQIRSATYFMQVHEAKNFLVEHNNEVAIYLERGKSKPNLVRWFYNYQAGLLKKFTSAIHSKMDKIIYLNKENIPQGADEKKYKYFPRLFVAFDHPTFQVKSGTKITLLFVGAMDWYPNASGIKWFIEKVLPLLPVKMQLQIVGRNAVSALEGFAAPNLQIFSDVDSVEPFYLAADIFISPVFSGSGINLKMLEAASYGIPIVATPFSTRGFHIDFLDKPNDEKEFAAALTALIPEENRKKMNLQIISWYRQYVKEAAMSMQQIFTSMKNE